MSRASNRLGEIDIIRALAIFLVIGFHWGTRWTTPWHLKPLYPYGDSVANWTIFRYGYLGVELFFIVSGFVIALTLERCKDILEFAIRRLARLLPSMIVCSILTILVVKYILPVEPFASDAQWINLLPSWTFLKPSLWRVFVPNINYVDGVYWSLFVEAKFYFWAALLYFVFKKNFSIIFISFSSAMLLFAIIGKQYVTAHPPR